MSPISSSNITTTTNNSNNNNDNQLYMDLIKKLLQFRLNNWPKFQDQLKKLLLAEICQTETETQIKPKEPTTNTHTTAKKYLQNFKSPTETSPIKRSHQSLIHQPIPKIDNCVKTYITNSKPNNEKAKHFNYPSQT